MKSLDAICAKLSSTKQSQTDNVDEHSSSSKTSSRANSVEPASKRRRKCTVPRNTLSTDQSDLSTTVTAVGQEISKSAFSGQSTIDKEPDSDSGSLCGDLLVENQANWLRTHILDQPSTGTDSPPNSETGSQCSTTNPVRALAISKANPSVEHFIKKYNGQSKCVGKCPAAYSYKEHYHCVACPNALLFVKKEDMLKHYNWHRKKQESLAVGFLRYTALEECSDIYSSCVHNLKQTHYHCVQPHCDKTYLSTSDVQMHANSHRKAAHIESEGFQRFKATEQCGYDQCPFREPGHRTTHFHCLRPDCTHSFKNKADIDKHKAHHSRDEKMVKDGFRKFLKSDKCPYSQCSQSAPTNHIHCLRPGCNYVLHSTSQMNSHKRKHERQANLGDQSGLLPKLAPKSEPEIPNLAGEPSISNPLSDAVSPQMVNTQNTPNPAQDSMNFLSFMQQNTQNSQELLNKNANNLNIIAAAAMFAASQSLISQQSNNNNNTGTLPMETLKALAPVLQQILGLGQSQVTNGINDNGTTAQMGQNILPTNHSRVCIPISQSASPVIPQNVINRSPVAGGIRIKMKEYDPATQNFNHTSTIGGQNQSSSLRGVRDLSATGVNHAPKAAIPQRTNDSLSPRKSAEPNKTNTSINGVTLPKSTISQSPLDLGFLDQINSLMKPIDNDQINTQSIDTSSKLNPAATTSVNSKDLWDEWVRRYTANDLCRPLCVLLYKDHYHCTAGQNCQKIFKGKEGIREHLKQHQQLLLAIPNYQTVQSDQQCHVMRCSFADQKQTHYHCLMADCTEAIGDSESPFQRLVHHKFHGLTNQSIDGNQSDESLNNSQSRRGRPRTVTSPNHSNRADDSGIDLDLSTSSLSSLNMSCFTLMAANRTCEPGHPASAHPNAFSIDHQCGRPFCKLKRRVHYHCRHCQHAFSAANRLLSHLQKHHITLSPSESAAVMDQYNSIIAKSQNIDQEIDKKSINQRNIIDEPINYSKKPPVQPEMRLISESPKGNNHDKNIAKTNNHNAKSGSSTPNGTDFMSQIITCSIMNCDFSTTKGLVHYHCNKCSTFVANDTTKLAIHLKQHEKSDQIVSFGFVKIDQDSQDNIQLCTLSGNCQFDPKVTTHYHCQKCAFSARSYGQMLTHSQTHLFGN